MTNELEQISNDYWWGTFTPELAKEGWVDNGEEPPYKKYGDNGRWTQIRFYHDGAIYSYCKCCGYSHNATDRSGPWAATYDPKREFKYCPECGKNMHIKRRFKNG